MVELTSDITANSYQLRKYGNESDTEQYLSITPVTGNRYIESRVTLT
jgi:hypothetical protein